MQTLAYFSWTQETGELQYSAHDQLLINLSTHQGWACETGLWAKGTFTLVHTSCSQGKECKTAFWRWDSAIFSSDNTHTTEEQYLGLQLQTGHQATVQYIYTRLSLVAFSPISALSRFMWSSSYRDGGRVLSQVSRKNHPPKVYHLLHKCPVALPSGKHHLCPAIQVHFYPHDSSVVSRKVMGLGTAEVHHHVIHLISLPCLVRVQKRPPHWSLKAITWSRIVTGLHPAALDFTL